MKHVALAAALALGLAPGTAALAHDWYPAVCCSDKDCWPAGEGGQEPEPKAGPTGWVLHDGTVVPYAAARPSPDGRFHVCRSQGRRDGSVIRPVAQPPCLWAPVPGS